MERGTRLPQRKGLAEDSPTPSRGMQRVPGGCSGSHWSQSPSAFRSRILS